MKVQPPMVTSVKSKIVLTFEAPKEAVPVGTVAGVQFEAAPKLFEPGLDAHVASCAAAGNAEHPISAVVTSKVWRRRPKRARAPARMTHDALSGGAIDSIFNGKHLGGRTNGKSDAGVLSV